MADLADLEEIHKRTEIYSVTLYNVVFNHKFIFMLSYPVCRLIPRGPEDVVDQVAGSGGGVRPSYD